MKEAGWKIARSLHHRLFKHEFRDSALKWKEHRTKTRPWFLIIPSCVQFSSVTQSCRTLCDPMDCRTPGFPVHHQLPELAQIHVLRVSNVIQPSHPSNHLCHPLLLPSIFPSIRVFSNESVLCMKWPKYWSFSFSSSPSNECGFGQIT